MNSANRSVIITGNWKMYKTIEESAAFIQELIPLISESSTSIYLAVPFTAIQASAEAAKNTPITIGAQNMNDATEGAFTGEIAGKMLVDAGAKFVIIGHSERRRIFNESNEFINRKVKRALLDGLQVTLCIGESKQDRDAEKTHAVLTHQITECLADLNADQLQRIVLAYEPVWAIGSMLPATPEMAQETQRFCRQLIAEKWDENIAEKIIIQYGGSVKADNAKEFLDQPDIDGLLVGGASLSAPEFSKIINCYH